ncbi:unnamed protein product [Hymenolepis diminuta]|uniref:Uncharacterized protein n=1 Tax=Hymenolepis diminuta TaxID=6216 RepID=A0A564ZB32_HYMDI|nr:unnamed protein product [Hymenolepis diminuta]
MRIHLKRLIEKIFSGYIFGTAWWLSAPLSANKILLPCRHRLVYQTSLFIVFAPAKRVVDKSTNDLLLKSHIPNSGASKSVQRRPKSWLGRLQADADDLSTSGYLREEIFVKTERL